MQQDAIVRRACRHAEEINGHVADRTVTELEKLAPIGEVGEVGRLRSQKERVDAAGLEDPLEDGAGESRELRLRGQ